MRLATDFTRLLVILTGILWVLALTTGITPVFLHTGVSAYIRNTGDHLVLI